MAPIRRQFRDRNPDPESKDLITSPNLASMAAFISDLQMDQERRNKTISFCTRHYSNTFSLKLSHLIRSSPHLQAVLFDIFVNALFTPAPFFDISPMILSEIKPLILECLRQECSTKPASKVLSRIVAGIAFRVYRDFVVEKWPELLDYETSLISAPDDKRKLQKWGLLIFRNLPENALQQIDYRFGPISAAIMRHLFSSDLDIRSAAIRATLSLVKSCKRHHILDELLPRMVSSTEDLIASGEHDLAGKALRTLVKMAMEEPAYLVERLGILFESVVRIAERGDIDEEMRAEAVQVLRELEDACCDEMKKMLERLSDESVERFVRLMVNFLEYVEEDPYWYRVDRIVTETDNNMEERRTILLGTYFLDRMSFLHKGKVLEIVVRLARERVRDQEWRKRHAGITAISLITEGCSEAVLDHLEEVITITVGLFRDVHPRVRGAAINAIRGVALDLGRSIVQEKYHDRILPALAHLVGDSLNPTLQVQAAIALVFFCKGCKPGHLAPFLDGLLRRLITACQSQHQRVQEWGFAALASVATSSESNFKQVYDPTMAFLKDILSGNTDRSKKLIRAKCLECISSVASAVGRETFFSDSFKIMDTLMSLQGSLARSDHGIRKFIYQALANFFNCLGEDLAPYVPDLMPILLRSSQLYNPGEAAASSNQGNKIDGLKEKALACKVMFCMAKQLRKILFPWIMKIANALVPLLQFSEDLETKQIATSALPELLHSAMSFAERGKSQVNATSLLQKLVILVVPALSEALEKETQIRMCTKFLNAIYKCTQVAGTIFSRAQGTSIVQGIKKVLANISERDQHEEEYEDDFEIDMEEEVKEEEEEILVEVTNCLLSLIKRFKCGFLPDFDEIVTYIPMMWDDRRNSKEKAMGFSIFRNIVRQCGKDAQKYYEMYLPCVLKACKDDDPSVRQEAALGIGTCAEFGGDIFKTQVTAAMESLDPLMNHSEALTLPENGKTFDAAVSALGKICIFHRNSVNSTEVVPAWLSYLPLVRDLDEAKLVHDQLFEMVEARDYDLFGPGNQNVPVVIAVLEEIVEQKETLATKDTAKRMTLLLSRLKSEFNL